LHDALPVWLARERSLCSSRYWRRASLYASRHWDAWVAHSISQSRKARVWLRRETGSSWYWVGPGWDAPASQARRTREKKRATDSPASGSTAESRSSRTAASGSKGATRARASSTKARQAARSGAGRRSKG